MITDFKKEQSNYKEKFKQQLKDQFDEKEISIIINIIERKNNLVLVNLPNLLNLSNYKNLNDLIKKSIEDIIQKNEEILKISISDSDVSVLCSSILENNFDITKLLIELKPDLNQKEKLINGIWDLSTPLIQAIWNKNREIIVFLLNNGADINFTNK